MTDPRALDHRQHIKTRLRRLIQNTDGQQAVPLSLMGIAIALAIINFDLIADVLEWLAELLGNVSARLVMW